MKILRIVKNIWTFLGAAAGVIDQARVLFPKVEILDRIDARLDRVLEERKRLAELQAEIDVELAQQDIGPRTREVLVRIRKAIALVP